MQHYSFQHKFRHRTIPKLYNNFLTWVSKSTGGFCGSSLGEVLKIQRLFVEQRLIGDNLNASFHSHLWELKPSNKPQHSEMHNEKRNRNYKNPWSLQDPATLASHSWWFVIILIFLLRHYYTYFYPSLMSVSLFLIAMICSKMSQLMSCK